MEKNKKGELTTNVLVSMTLLIIVAVVLISFVGYFFFKSDLRGYIDDIACERSIQDRATYNINGIIEPGKNLIPLKCDTKQVCFSESGGDCEDVFGKSSKDNPVIRHTIPSGKTVKEEVLDYVAESLKKYHTILGQGKLDFMPHRFADETSCPIYSWIALDEEIREDAEDITYYELYEYMQKKKMDDGTSYLTYVYPGWKSAGIVTSKLFEKVNEEDDRFKHMTIDDWKIDLNRRNGYVVLGKIQTPGKWGQYLGTSLVAGSVVVGTGLAIFTGGFSLAAIPAAIGIAAAGTGGAAVLGGVTYVITAPGGSLYHSPMVYPYDANALREMECSDWSVVP